MFQPKAVTETEAKIMWGLEIRSCSSCMDSVVFIIKFQQDTNLQTKDREKLKYKMTNKQFLKDTKVTDSEFRKM